VLHVARCKYRTQKMVKNVPSGHHRTTLSGYIFATKARIDNCPHNMVNFGPLAAEIGSGVWGTPANFNGFRVLAVSLHSSQVMGVCQTLRRCTEGATYIRRATITLGIGPHSSLKQFCSSLMTMPTAFCKNTKL